MKKKNAVATLDTLRAVLVRHEAGETIQQVADSLKTSPQALYRGLLKHFPEDWRDQKSARALLDMDEAEKELKDAKDNVAVARSRERIALAKWNLERLARGLYGDRLSVEHSAITPMLIIEVVGETQESPIKDVNQPVTLDHAP